MKIVRINKLWLGRRFYAINLFGIVFARGGLNRTMERHEYIHTLQQREMLWVGFYLWYAVEWIVKFLYYRNAYRSYENISFEREAYGHQHEAEYAKRRRFFAWLREIRRSPG